MTAILMCGVENGTETLNTLFAAIRSVHLAALHIGEESVSMIPPKKKSPDFTVIDNGSIKNVHMGGGIALFRKNMLPKQHIEIPPAFFAVVDSDNSEAVDILRGDGIQTVTCGLSQKDTVTFSSLEQDRAVISLQRKIKTLDGSFAEPAEIPVAFSPSQSVYPILAAAAVLLISGSKFDEDGLNLK